MSADWFKCSVCGYEWYDADGVPVEYLSDGERPRQITPTPGICSGSCHHEKTRFSEENQANYDDMHSSIPTPLDDE